MPWADCSEPPTSTGRASSCDHLTQPWRGSVIASDPRHARSRLLSSPVNPVRRALACPNTLRSRSLRTAKDFFTPLAVGAPAPLREIPARPSRAIHFFDPGNEKLAAKIPALVGTSSDERREGKECVRKCRSRWWQYH